MECDDIRKRLTAWVDGELPARQAHEIERHLDRCPKCRLSAQGQRQMVQVLNALPAMAAPAGFSRRTLRAFRMGLEPQNLIQWWQHLNFIMRGAVCGAALAGLLFGAVMGTSLAAPDTDSPITSYHALYAGTGIFP